MTEIGFLKDRMSICARLEFLSPNLGDNSGRMVGIMCTDYASNIETLRV